jgi:hypothetical protein
MKAATVNGEEVTVHLKGKVFINDAQIVAYVETDNGLFMPLIR